MNEFAMMYEQFPLGIAICDLEGHILDVNMALARLLGFAAAELRGVHLSGITHPDDLPDDIAQAENLMRGDADCYWIDKRYVRRDGRPIRVRAALALLRSPDQAPLRVIGIVDYCLSHPSSAATN
jgi:PAS domain S-box-containing protein